MNSWLSDAYGERGWSEGQAGALLAVMNLSALGTTLAVPWVADRACSRRVYLVVLGAVLTGATLGFVLVPAGGRVWAALSAVAGMMLGGGHTVSAAAPFLLGAVRDETGSFTVTLWLLAAASACLLGVCATMSRERLRRGLVLGQPAAS